MQIQMIETQQQRDSQRLAEYAPKMLGALQVVAALPAHCVPREVRSMVDDAIEYATGAHDPGLYPDDGYETDAAGTAIG